MIKSQKMSRRNFVRNLIKNLTLREENIIYLCESVTFLHSFIQKIVRINYRGDEYIPRNKK